MKLHYFLLSWILLLGFLHSGNYIRIDPSSTPVADVVVQKYSSYPGGGTAPLGDEPNIITNPPGFTTAPGRYKWDGAAMVELTAGEMSSIDAARTAEANAAGKASAKDRLRTDAELDALIEGIIGTMERYTRDIHSGDPPKTPAALKAEALTLADSRIDS